MEGNSLVVTAEHRARTGKAETGRTGVRTRGEGDTSPVEDTRRGGRSVVSNTDNAVHC